MSAKKLIVVVGATGNQGSPVVRSLVKNEEFAVRGISRNPESEKSKALTELGATVVKADLWEKEELKAAFEGAWAVFVNTNSEDPDVNQPGGPTEFDRGKIVIDAVAEAGVKTLVYSGGANVERITDGKATCYMMMNKARIFEYAKTRGFTNLVDVPAAWFLEMFAAQEIAGMFGGFPFVPDSEGYLSLVLPPYGNVPELVPFIGLSDDYGDIVHGVLLNPARYNGQLVQGVSALISLEGFVQAFVKATGKKARFAPLKNADEFPTYGDPGLEDIKNMFRFFEASKGGYFDGAQGDVTVPKALKKQVGELVGKETELVSIDAWMQKTFGEK